MCIEVFYLFQSFIVFTVDVRYFPKGFFPIDNFPNLQFPKRQIPKFVLATALDPYPVLAAALGPPAHPSRRARLPIAACGASEGLT